MMLPTALVLPSLNTILVSGRRYSGYLMNRNKQVALSPVRKSSRSMLKMEAVCLVLPEWTVVGQVHEHTIILLCQGQEINYRVHMHDCVHFHFSSVSHAH